MIAAPSGSSMPTSEPATRWQSTVRSPRANLIITSLRPWGRVDGRHDRGGFTSAGMGRGPRLSRVPPSGWGRRRGGAGVDCSLVGDRLAHPRPLRGPGVSAHLGAYIRHRARPRAGGRAAAVHGRQPLCRDRVSAWRQRSFAGFVRGLLMLTSPTRREVPRSSPHVYTPEWLVMRVSGPRGERLDGTPGPLSGRYCEGE